MSRRAQWVPVGAIERFARGSMRIVDAGGLSIGVAHSPSGIHAIRNRCPHQGGPVCEGGLGATMMPSAPWTLVPGLDTEVVRCPWHGWEFLACTGEPAFGAAKGRLQRYPVRVREGVLEVELPADGAAA